MNEKQVLTLLNGEPVRKFTIIEEALLRLVRSGASWLTKTGNPLSFLARGSRLLQHYIYSCSLEQSGTPSPTSPKPLICSNGAITYRNKITIDGTEYVLPADVQLAEYAKFDGVSTKVDTGLTEYKNTYKYLIGIKRYSTVTKFVSFQNPDNTRSNIGLYAHATGYFIQNGVNTRRTLAVNATEFHDIIIEQDGYTLDGNKQTIAPVAEFTIADNLYIGCASNNGVIDARYTEDAISYYAVINGTTPLYIGVPVYKANGDFAWLDLVSGTYSTITGTLTAGNKVAKEMVTLGRTDNLFDVSKVIHGTISSSTGEVVTTATYREISDFIEVSVGETLSFSGKGCKVGSSTMQNASFIKAFYDSNKAFISGSRGATNSPLTIPSGASYVRFELYFNNIVSGDVVDIDKTETNIVKGSTAPTEYIPYWSLSGEKGKAKLNNILPLGYTPLEYIQSTGTQYIDTGISPAGKKIGSIVDFQFTDTSRATGGIFGSNKTDGTDNCQFTVYNSKWRIKINNYATYGVNYDTNRHIARLNMPDGTSLDDTVYTSTQYTIASGNTNNVFIGACNYGSSSSTETYTLIGKLYSAKVYDDTTLVRDYVPAKNSSNVVGLYDKVSGQFFTNAGTGDFTAGPELSNGAIVGLPTILKGNVDLVLGSGSEEWGIKVFDGTETIVKDNNRYYYRPVDMLNEGATRKANLKCTHFVPSTVGNTGQCFKYNAEIYLYPDMTLYPDAASFKSWLEIQYANGTPVIVAYPKSSASAISVTPVALSQRDGQNEASATLKELHGSLSVTYYGEEEPIMVGNPLRMDETETESTETENTESEVEDEHDIG